MLNYEQVAGAIESEGRKIGQVADEIAVLAVNAAKAEVEYKTAYAASRVKFRDACQANGVKYTVDMIDDHATLEAADSLLNCQVSRESLIAAREALKAAQARLDGLRTLAAGHRQGHG